MKDKGMFIARIVIILMSAVAAVLDFFKLINTHEIFELFMFCVMIYILVDTSIELYKSLTGKESE